MWKLTTVEISLKCNLFYLLVCKFLTYTDIDQTSRLLQDYFLISCLTWISTLFWYPLKVSLIFLGFSFYFVVTRHNVDWYIPFTWKEQALSQIIFSRDMGKRQIRSSDRAIFLLWNSASQCILCFLSDVFLFKRRLINKYKWQNFFFIWYMRVYPRYCPPLRVCFTCSSSLVLDLGVR